MAKTTCPVCGASTLVQVVQRENVPVHQHLVFKDQSDALLIERGDLAIAACERCGFVFNRAFDESKLRYGKGYENSQHASPRYQAHVRERIRHLIEAKKLRNARIIEIGCGNGAFLRELVQANATNTGIGFDLSYSGSETDLDGRVRFVRRFYDETFADLRADVIICRHVIEHIPDPITFLSVIHKALQRSPQAQVFFETPDVEWILKNRVVWDFFYEHCSYFSGETLAAALAQTGFAVDQISSVFGDQYLWTEAHYAQPEAVQPDPAPIVAQAREFASENLRRLAAWETIIGQLSQQYRLALWGAGAKGITFANLIDPQRQHFACVVDLNPVKQGGFAAGTGHPIISPQELGANQITCVALLNPEYEAEIAALLQTLSLPIKIVNLGTHEADH